MLGHLGIRVTLQTMRGDVDITASAEGRSSGRTHPSDGLVVLPDRAPTDRAPGTRRAVRQGAIACFLCLLVGTGVIDAVGWLRQPGPPTPAETHGSTFERFVRGTLARNLEGTLKDRSTVRQHLVPPYVLARYRLLGDLGNDLLVGPGGWIFLRSRVEVTMGSDHHTIERATFRVVDMQRRAAQLGIRLVTVPIPRKSALLPEKLPAGFDDNHHLDILFADALRRQGADFVDLLPILRRFAENPHGGADGDVPYRNVPYSDGPHSDVPYGDTSYFVADSHWTESAARVTAEAIAHHTGLWVPAEDRETLLQVTTRPSQVDLLLYAGGPHTARWANFWDPGWAHRHWVTFPRATRHLKPQRSWDHPAPLVLAGTSFARGSWLVNLLTHFSQRRWLDISAEGCPALTPLLTFLAHRRTQGLELPSVIVVEAPNDLLLNTHLAAPRDVFPLRDSEWLDTSSFLPRQCYSVPEFPAKEPRQSHATDPTP